MMRTSYTVLIFEQVLIFKTVFFVSGREKRNQICHAYIRSFSVFDQGYYIKSSVITDYVITIK